MNDIKDSGSGENLVRRMGLFDSTMMMVGIVIGSGIFLITGFMAESLPSTGMILLAWVVGGLLVMAGALTFGELGASFPQAGGQYVYLREAYGKLPGFLFGWILLLVSMGGAIAAAAVGFATYLGYFFPALSMDNILLSVQLPTGQYTLAAGQIVGVVAIVLLSGVNFVGAGLGKTVQNIISVIKITTILGLVILGLTLGKPTPFNGSESIVNGASPGFSQLLIGFGVALIAVSWAFDGWHNINYVAGEIKNPKRNLPLTLILGTLLITFLYLMVNLVYVRALPIEEMRGAARIAEKAGRSLFGGPSAGIIAAAVLISTFGSLNGVIFAAPRVYFAMARDRVFFQKAADVHPKFKTPHVAILIQSGWACLLALSGTYEQLFTYVTFINLIFWIAGTASVFRLRKKNPDLPRPYKTWGYPVVPIFFLIALSGILINTLLNRPVESLAGLALTLLGIPVYLYWNKKK